MSVLSMLSVRVFLTQKTKVPIKFGVFIEKHLLCRQRSKHMESNTTNVKVRGRHVSMPFFSYSSRFRNKVNIDVVSLDDEKSRIKVALDKLSYLKSGWDGLDALPVCAEAVSNVLQLLAVSENKDWQDWTIEPNINGTLTLRTRSHTSAISLGSDSFSFFVKEGKSITGKDNIPFTAEAVVKFMKSLNQ